MGNGESLFGAVERTIRIRIMGKDFTVPAEETLLRCFQYLSPEEVSRGRFCWAGTCGNSQITYRVRSGPERPARACRLIAVEGLEVTSLTPELAWALRRLLPELAPSPPAGVS